jgi:alpha-methylacyl-CoA racemase
MLLAFGVLAALSHARQTGQGQVVDAAITEGSALLTALIQGWRSSGLWNAQAGTNNGDGGAHFYDAYACADGKYVSIGAMEPQFYALLRHKCGLDDPAFDAQWNPADWPTLKARMADMFRMKTRAQWCTLLEGSDACFAPVLDLDEAPLHPHNVARHAYARVNGITQPAPAPRFSHTPAGACQPVGEAGADTRRLLAELGCDAETVARLMNVAP